VRDMVDLRVCAYVDWSSVAIGTMSSWSACDVLNQEGGHQLGIVHLVTSVSAVGVNWGQEQEKQTARHVAAAQIISAFKWQVGQESHPHPAVLEPAAVCSGAFRDVHEHT